MTKKTENRVVSGEVVKLLPNTMFQVDIGNGTSVIGIPSGKMRRGHMRLMPGTRVKVEFTPYDSARGRIIEGAKPRRSR